MIRQWLSAAITGSRPVWSFAPEQDIHAFIAEADGEGICALLHEQISRNELWADQMPVAFREGIAQLAREKALQSLLREHECKRVLALLGQASVSVLLLKGTALAYWAYETPHARERGDIDLFLRSKAEVDIAVKLLAGLKFELVETALSGDLISFEVTARREMKNGIPLEIDLHWHLSNTPMFAFRFGFDELMDNAVSLPKLAQNAYGLAPVPAYLHACMHRVQNMSIGAENNLRWLFDLYVLGQKFSTQNWQELLDTAKEKQLAEVCVDSLQAAAICFGAQAPHEIVTQLAQAAKHEPMDVAKMHSWFYIQRMNFFAYPRWRQRFRWLRQRLLPDIAYLQSYYGEEQGFWRMLGARVKGGLRRFKS